MLNSKNLPISKTIEKIKILQLLAEIKNICLIIGSLITCFITAGYFKNCPFYIVIKPLTKIWCSSINIHHFLINMVLVSY